MDFKITIVFTLLAGAWAGPARLRSVRSAPATCSQQCTENSKFSYAPGTTYQFNYAVETKTAMLGVSLDHATIGIYAKADVEVHSKCEMVLRLREAQVFGYDSQSYNNEDTDGIFAQMLEQYPLSFSFQDGLIDSICPDDREVSWALNIKRGVLSAFQNTMTEFEEDHQGRESDVTGRCDVEYTVTQKGWLTMTVKKSKDLLTCTNRNGYESAIQTTPFRISSGLKTLPLLKSTYDCDQEIKTDGTLISVVCHELHVFRPFSKDTSGASTESEQKLTFLQQIDSISDISRSGNIRGQLFFDHSHGEEVSAPGAREALTLLRQICRSTADDIRPETPTEFSSLVHIMKSMDYNGLKRVYNQVKDNKLCPDNPRTMKFAMDAFPMVGTGASVRLMKEFISNGVVTGVEAEMWMASLAFIHHPTKEMLTEIKELMGLSALASRVVLPLSAMVHSFCRLNTECGEVPEVQEVVGSLVRNIPAECVIDEQNYKIAMLTLHAIGNTGHAQVAIPALENCFSNDDNPMDIRVSAIEAFRRLSCGADRNNLMVVYRNSQLDAELRVAAYLAMMRCPTQNIVDQIIETLKTEEVNQVGSFVWTHITNLIESSDPANRYVQSLLPDAIELREFDLDKRKFSRNYEGSFFIEKFNSGAKIDSNLVWSSSSFIPRSAAVNLTFDLFGESMNLFEIGGRVEGLERLLESYFGPMGYFKDPEKDNQMPPLGDPRNAGLSASKIKQIRSKATSKMDELRGALYLRMFGNELSYTMFGSQADESSLNLNLFDFLQKLRHNEDQDISLMKSVTFLDSSIIVPTLAGLPLNLTINGTASVAIKTTGHTDMQQPRSNIVIEGAFEPSGAVEIQSMMSVDAHVTRGGLKMVSNLHTSTGVKAKIELTNRQILAVNFDLTRDRSEIINVQSSLFMVYPDFEKKMSVVDELSANYFEKETCADSSSSAVRMSGLRICAGMKMPNTSGKADAPYFPFTGPAGLSLYLLKDDIPNGYKLEAKSIHNPSQTLFRFLADTPGSSINRAVGLDVVLGHSDKTLMVTLDSPWKNIEFNGNLLDSASVKGVFGKATVDKTREYVMDVKVQIEKSDNRRTYTPTVIIQIPNYQNIEMSGTVNYLIRRKLDLDLSMTGVRDHPVVLQTTIMNTDTEVGAVGKFHYVDGEIYQMEAVADKKIERKRLKSRYFFTPRASLKTPTATLANLTGSLEFIPGKSFRSAVKLTDITRRPIVATVDLTRAFYHKRNREKYNGRVNIQAPRVTSKMVFSVDKRSNKMILSKVRMDYNLGKGLKDTLIVNNKIINHSIKTATVVKMNNDVNFLKSKDFNSKMLVDFSHKRWLTSLDVNLAYGSKIKEEHNKQKLNLALVAKHRLADDRTAVNYTVTFRMPAEDVDILIKGGHVNDRSNVDTRMAVRYDPERTVKVGLLLHNKTVQDLPYYAGHVFAVMPDAREIELGGHVQKMSADKYGSSLEFALQKGQKSRIETELKIVTNHTYEFAVNLYRPQRPDLQFSGAFSKDTNGFTVNGKYVNGTNTYSSSFSTMIIEGESAKISLDLVIPERHVIIELKGAHLGTDRSGLIDIKWDADSDEDKRFLFNTTIGYVSTDDMELNSILHYPSRTVNLKFKHSTGDRYITRFELSWNPEKRIKASMIFRNDEIKGVGRTELSVAFVHPFSSDINELGLDVSKITDTSQHQTKASLTWLERNKSKKILISTTVKVPVALERMDMVGSIVTPFEGYEGMTASMKVRLDEKPMTTNMLLQWGRKRISVITESQYAFTGISRTVNANWELHTPFEGLRRYIITIDHTDNGNVFSSNLHLQKDLDNYILNFDMNHVSTILELRNTGTLRIQVPFDDIRTTWKLERTQANLHTFLDIMPSRGNQFKVEFQESHQTLPHIIVTSTFELLIPTETMRELQISFKHENDDFNFVKTLGTITKDRIDIFSSGIDYENKFGSTELTMHFSSPLNEDLLLKMSSAHAMMPYSSRAEVKWAPHQVITVDSSWFHNEFGMFEHVMRISTPFQGFQSIYVKSSRSREDLNWVAKTEVDMGRRQRIVFNSLYRFDHVKLTTISLQTPYPQFPGFETSFKVDGSPTNFRGDAAFIMQPYVGRTTVDFNWAYYSGSTLSGEFNLNTQHPKYPYMRARLNSNLLGISRVSSFELEYFPNEIIKVDTDYRFTAAETLQGTITIASPFTEQDLVAGFTHTGNRMQFNTNARITCECFPRPVMADASFSAIKAINLAFNMDSHFRGYETVKLTFDHEGVINDFQTVATYETNGEKITLESLLKLKKVLKGKLLLTTPFQNLTKAELQFLHKGNFPNTHSHAEAWLNEKSIVSNVDFSHDALSSVGTVVINTPFEGYEKLKAGVNKAGPVSDLTVNSEVSYGPTILATLRHTYDGRDISTRATLTAPFLEDQSLVVFRQRNNIEDWEQYYEVSAGQSINMTRHTKFSFTGNVLKASVLEESVVGEQESRSFVALDHRHNIAEGLRHIDIKSSLVTDYGKYKANIDFNYTSDSTETEQSREYYLTIELPLKEFQYYKMSSTAHTTMVDGTVSGKGIDKYEMSGMTQPYTNKYELLVTKDKHYRYEHQTILEPGQESVLLVTGSPGSNNVKLTTWIEGYEVMEMENQYRLEINNVRYYSQFTYPGNSPAEFELTWNFPETDVTDLTATAEFTSGIENFENVRAHLEMNKNNMEYRPHMLVTWAPDNQLTLDGNYQMNLADGVFVSGIALKSPFEKARMANVQVVHKYFSSPIRAKEVIVIEYNDDKYLDTTLEVSAEHKISGSLTFEAPRPMEFGISVLNEGESVDSSVLINWDKAKAKSQVHFELGYADNGDSVSVNKDIKLRFTHPERIVGLVGNFQSRPAYLKSNGKVIWDEEAGREASYDWEFGNRDVRGGTMYDTTMKMTVPARSIEVTGSLNTGLQQQVIDGTFFWDVESDRNKQVNTKVTLGWPTDVRRIGQVEIHLPSFDKELTVRSEATLNDGTKLFEGTTEISYSQEDRKKISLKSAILNLSDDSNHGYSLQWSLTHPYTNTDIQMTTSVDQSESKVLGSADLSYLMTDQEKKNFTWTSTLDKTNRQLDIQVTSPSNTAELQGQLTAESPYSFTVQTFKNSQPTWKTVWIVDTVKRNLEASMTYDEANLDKTIQTTAYFPNETAFTSVTSKLSGSENTEEGKITAYLNSSRLLHGHITWRPDMLLDVVRFAGSALNHSGSELISVLNDISEDVGDEVTSKYAAIGRSLSEELSPFSQALAKEVNNLQRELANMRRELRRMYKKNDLYLKTLEEVYSGAVESMLNGYSASITRVRQVYSKLETKIEQITKKLEAYPIQERYNALIGKISDCVESFQAKAQEEIDLLLQQMADKLAEFSGQYEQFMNTFMEDVKQKIVEFVDEFALEPYMEDLKEAYETVLGQYPNMAALRDTDVKALLTKVHSAMLAALEKSTLTDKYRTVYLKTSEILNQQFGSLMRNPDFQNLHQSLNEVYQQTAWLYQYMEVDSSLRDLLNKMLMKVREQVIKEFNQLPIGLLDMHKSRFTTFDLENGEIEFDLYLPIPMENFEEIMRFKIENYMKRLRMMADKYFPRRDFCMWDWVYNIRPVQLTSKDFVPPFDAYGIVSGKQHYTTFDGQHFDFAGLCSYILAEDTVDRNFTVVQKYKGGPRRLKRDSLVVMTQTKTVELFQDYMVHVDGQPTELPYQHDKLTIIRAGQQVILDSGNGLDIIANFDKDFHIIGLSGWYFGKTAGLLGTYDNEQYNDMMLPDGEMADRPNRFAVSWEVAGSCKSRRNYADQDDGEKSEECSAVFEKTSSPLRPCFLQVDPESYQHSCDAEPARVCDIASLYVMSCTRSGVSVDVPPSCVQCTTHDNQRYSSGDNIRYSTDSDDLQPHSAMDTVFVVEERQCNHDVADKLSDIVYQMEQSLSASGMTDNRYSLIGYAGNSVSPHTMEGQIFNEARTFTMGIESLKFENLGPYTDPLSAVMIATDLAFRAGVRKTVVLVSCSPCSESSGYTYTALRAVLQRRGITLHVLRQSGFLLTENRSPTSQIYGIDNNQVISGQATRSREQDLFSDIEIPNDYCASLALSNNGSLFDVSHVLSGNVRQQRDFIGTVGQRMGESGPSTSCQECSCELDASGAAVSVCRTCDSGPAHFMKNIPGILKSTVSLGSSASQHFRDMLTEFY